MTQARAVKNQTDRLNRQLFHMGQLILETGQGSSANGIVLTGLYINPPVFVVSPPAVVDLTQDGDDYYTGADLTPIGTDYTIYNYVAVCSGLVSPIQNLNNKGAPVQFNGYASGGGAG